MSTPRFSTLRQSSNAPVPPPQVTAGSADRMVNIWDAKTRGLLYRLPGHNGSVNEVVFHPKVSGVGTRAQRQGGAAAGITQGGVRQQGGCLVGDNVPPPPGPPPCQEPIVASASSDKTIYLGELAS